MRYKISTSYNWYQTEKERFIIKAFYINGVPFTFDELPKELQKDSEIIKLANDEILYTPEIFYLRSSYLIEEECHPCIFELELENPEEMPDEDLYNGGDLCS